MQITLYSHDIHVAQTDNISYKTNRSEKYNCRLFVVI